MNNPTRWYRPRRLLSALLFALLAACSSVAPAPAETPFLTAQKRGPTDWREERIYFAVTDRFANGDRRNDNGVPGLEDDADRANPLGWHGGDFAGLEQKIKEGYFERLGFSKWWK